MELEVIAMEGVEVNHEGRAGQDREGQGRIKPSPRDNILNGIAIGDFWKYNR